MFAPQLLLALALQASSTTPSADRGSTPAPQADTTKTPVPVPQADANGVYHSLQGMTPPEVTHQVEPKYSDAVSGMKFSGRTVVGLIVDSKGKPTEIHVVRSAAEYVKDPDDKKRATDLDVKAMEAVRRYRFKPAQLDGKPVPVELNVQVNFDVF